MLLRTTPDGTLAIAQTTHAWVSGQMARLWGNDQFGTVEPHAAVLLAAEQHDIGWTAWEPEPTLNPETGKPHGFLELPPELHLSRIWSQAGPLALLTNRYAAMLVSMHGSGLYDRFRDDPEAAGGLAVKFLHEQDAFQARLIDSLSADPFYAPHVTSEAITRNRRLIALWDRLSLNFCWGMNDAMTIDNVPMANGIGSIVVMPVKGELDSITIDPWPFSRSEIDLIFEGRLLQRQAKSQPELTDALQVAPWRSIVVKARPAEAP